VKRTINPGIEIGRERETAKGFYDLLLSVSVLASCEALYCPQIDTVTGFQNVITIQGQLGKFSATVM
jgi:hypothetical protein